MRRLALCLSALALTFALGACVSVPGSTTEEKRAYVDDYSKESIEMLLAQSPELRPVVDAAAGTLVIRQSDLKIPLLGGGSGWGVITEAKDGKKTYVKLRKVELGAGWGARVSRIVAILKTQAGVDRALEGGFDWRMGAEAGAKAGDVGGGAQGAAGASTDPDVEVHVLLDSGVSATATVGLLRLTRLSSLN